MKNRMSDSSVWASRKFGRLPALARVLQLGLMQLADDQGRMSGDPGYLRGQFFPQDEKVTLDDVRRWLGLLVDNGAILFYEVDDEEYVQIANWWETQILSFAQPSIYPRPVDWQDRICSNGKGNKMLICNWVSAKGPMTDTCDQDGNLIPLPSMPAAAKVPSNALPQVPPKEGTQDPSLTPSVEGRQEGVKVNNVYVYVYDYDQEGEGEAALPPAPAKPPARILHSKNGATGKPFTFKSPHVDNSRFDLATGYIPAGCGLSAVEVYYERFDVTSDEQRLTPLLEDDLTRACPDLELLREVVTAYSRAGYDRKRNIGLILDWYREPARFRPKAQPEGSRSTGKTSNVSRSLAAIDEYEQMKSQGIFPQ